MKFLNWIKELFKDKPCAKTESGYDCKHRILSNGVKECG